MSFIEQDSRNSIPYSASDATESANYFAFFDKPTPENLAANHGGVLSLRQQKAVETMIAYQRSTIAVVGGMLILAAFFMGFLFWKIDASDGTVSFNAQLINAAVLLLIIGLFAGLFFGDWFVFFAEDDLENRVVESAAGRIEWNGRRYQMRTDTRLLRSLRSAVALPPPGYYRFYYLPRMGLVVLAEELLTGKEDQPSILFRALADSNNFTLEDLDQNRKGTLSKHQEAHLIKITVQYLIMYLAAALLFGSMVLQILHSLSSTGFLLLMIVGVVLVVRFSRSAGQVIADLWVGKVKSVDGPIAREIRRSRYSHSYYYVIDGYRFQVSTEAYNALVEGRPYRVYYASHSQQLLSLELL